MKKYKTSWIVLGVTVLYTLMLAVCGGGGNGFVQCPEGQVMCGDECVNWLKDDDNCGQCDNACGIHADCSNGECVCVAGFSDCSGQCVDLNTDSANCGMCNNACGAGECCCDSTCKQ